MKLIFGLSRERVRDRVPPPNVEGASVDHRVCGPRSPALHVVEQSIWRITPYPRLGLVVTTLRAAKAVWRLHFRMVTGCGL